MRPKRPKRPDERRVMVLVEQLEYQVAYVLRPAVYFRELSPTTVVWLAAMLPGVIESVRMCIDKVNERDPP